MTMLLDVTVDVPDEEYEEFEGKVKVVNLEDPDDFELIDVSLATSRSVSGCHAGTQITMTSAFPITKSIEDIIVGDHISSYNPITQMTTAAEVIDVHVYGDLPEYLIFNNNLEITPNHKLYINGIGWMKAENTQIGYYMLGNIPDTSDIYTVAIFSKEPSTGPILIYDLEIIPLASEATGYWADGILVGG